MTIVGRHVDISRVRHWSEHPHPHQKPGDRELQFGRYIKRQTKSARYRAHGLNGPRAVERRQQQWTRRILRAFKREQQEKLGLAA